LKQAETQDGDIEYEGWEVARFRGSLSTVPVGPDELESDPVCVWLMAESAVGFLQVLVCGYGRFI
jgi:hypothetical protein